MGLDILEIVLETEEEFDVKLARDQAPAPVGELFDLTLNALREQHPDRFEGDSNYAEKVWMQLKAMIVYQLGVDPEQVVKSANFFTDLGFV